MATCLVALSAAGADGQNTPSPPPTNLWAAQTSPTEITLAWRRVPGALLYRLYAMAGGEARSIGQTNASGDRYVQRIAEYGVPHLYAIEAVAENGSISERVRFNEVVPVSATRGIVAAPASVTAEPAGSGVIALRWSTVPEATAYMISRAVAPGGYRLLCSLCPVIPTYMDSATTTGAKHVYTVVALTPRGPSRPMRSAELVPVGGAVAAAPAAAPNAAEEATPKGSIRATPRPGSCLSLGGEGNFIVRMADGSVRTYDRVRWWAPGRPLSFPKDPQLAPVPGITDAVAVATSGKHWLALRSDGTILSWGSNDQGQLGRRTARGPNSTSAVRQPEETPAPVRDITNAVAIAAGAEHSVALLADGTIRTWGTGSHGVPGDGSPTSTNRFAPTKVAGIDNAVAVAAREFTTFAVLKDGAIRAWGSNRVTAATLGILGIGTNEESTNVPRPVAGITNAVGVALGNGGSAAAVLADGTVRAWGFRWGPRPKRGLAASNTPLPVEGVRDAVAISEYMALLRDGTVLEFPAGLWNWPTPKLSNVVAVASDHVNRLALLADGKLVAWGYKPFYPDGLVVRGELGAETARQCAVRGKS